MISAMSDRLRVLANVLLGLAVAEAVVVMGLAMMRPLPRMLVVISFVIVAFNLVRTA